jgi:catechol 2,3-dioxygenase-like lactoylglutathione lyase family enzyme
MSMLTKAVVTTILPVKDMARARDFYEKKLGLEPKGFAADGNYLIACGGDAHIALITKPEGTKAEHTALSFEVQGIERVILELQAKGLVFEDYDFPTLRPLITCASSARKRRPGSRTARETTCACTKGRTENGLMVTQARRRTRMVSEEYRHGVALHVVLSQFLPGGRIKVTET